jgi:hypothetical protein
MVSFRGHSQYLATWAKMTPWQIDCKMPSIRMGALIGTSVCTASDSEDIMGVDVGRPASCGDSLMHHLQSRSGPPRTTSQRRNTTRPTCPGSFPIPVSSHFPDLSHTHAPKDTAGHSTGMRAARRMLPCGPFKKMDLISSTVIMIKIS